MSHGFARRGAPSIGVDIVEVGRVEAALERRPRLADRLFSKEEQAYAAASRRPARRLAARFAAKEATVKALGLGAVPLTEIEVIEGAPPTLVLRGRSGETLRASGKELSLSLSHEREMAVAVVLAT